MIQMQIDSRRGRQQRRQERAVHQGARRFAPRAMPRSATSSSSRIKEALPGAKVKKGDTAKAVVVRTKREHRRARRQLHQVRRQQRRAHQPAARADRHPHLRAGRARASRQEVHEDHLARTGGALMQRLQRGDTVVVISGKYKGKQGRVKRSSSTTTRSSSRGSTSVKRHTEAERPQPAGRHRRERGAASSPAA